MKTLRDYQQAFESGALTSSALTQRCLAAIAAGDDALNAWLVVDEEGALSAADAVDQRRARGEELGPLAGIPIGIKDMLCTAGIETTAASKMLKGFVPSYDATAVARLKSAGAVVLGKLNMDEFAMGSSNERSAFGVASNPWDTARVPGGSSGGSAAAVAARMCPVSLGTDTGGSIRQPASFCGVVGIKPTYGRVSRWGAIAFASSLDQIGPLANTVDDAAHVLEAISGFDPLDSTSIQAPMPSLLDDPRADLKGLRVGMPREYLGPGLNPEVQRSVMEAIECLSEQGAELVDVTLPHTPYAVATYYLLATAECASNLARYDGVAYGHRTSRSLPLDDMIAASRSEGFGAEVTRRILLGTFALSSGYYDAYYTQAQKVRTLIRKDFSEAFARCDVIAGPTSPCTAIAKGDNVDDPLSMYLMDTYTIPASLAGLPCLSLPCGVDSARLPIGLQLIAPPLMERRLVEAARGYERQRGALTPCPFPSLDLVDEAAHD